MQPVPNHVKKIDFYLLFKDGFNEGQVIAVGKDERVEIKINSPKLDNMDMAIFKEILKCDDKKWSRGTLTCTFQASTLMNKLDINATVLNERLRKFLRVGLEVFTDQIDAEYNFFSLTTRYEGAIRTEYEIQVYNVEVIEKHFKDEIVNELKAYLPDFRVA
ncbi:hypothetical protein [Paenibacillus albus]|uniref:Uncharacterized protein n=1 Tax=Paenibacillus albus TaxID=2495582 RepID=A0A3Q8X3D6_9BACL|nr:hypothetical protein [Paenibacillus albus]AZN39545.1 hypothetical protein EJC50_07620 [Paenibacillus albus]